MSSSFAFHLGSGLRLAARGTRPALGAFLSAIAAAFISAPAANALPAPVLDTGGCTTAAPTNTLQVCKQSGALGEIFSQANLANLSATAQIDTGPYALTAQAGVYYYFSITSAGGPIYDWIPLAVTGKGTTSVGQSGNPTGGAGFNNNTASADIIVGNSSVFYACSGYSCNGPASFDGTRTAWVQAYSMGDDNPAELRVTLLSRVTTNSNYEHSFAHAFVDPIIQIDPTFLAAHPGLTLTFSEGVPTAVPLPASLWMFVGGLLGLVQVRHRQRK